MLTNPGPFIPTGPTPAGRGTVLRVYRPREALITLLEASTMPRTMPRPGWRWPLRGAGRMRPAFIFLLLRNPAALVGHGRVWPCCCCPRAMIWLPKPPAPRCRHGAESNDARLIWPICWRRDDSPVPTFATTS
jgi:hypothetical protein